MSGGRAGCALWPQTDSHIFHIDSDCPCLRLALPKSHISGMRVPNLAVSGPNLLVVLGANILVLLGASLVLD